MGRHCSSLTSQAVNWGSHKYSIVHLLLKDWSPILVVRPRFVTALEIERLVANPPSQSWFAGFASVRGNLKPIDVERPNGPQACASFGCIWPDANRRATYWGLLAYRRGN